MKENMEIWDSVSKTDPSHTKKVNQRGGFTAIDAHYQVMQATKQFGPIGYGWGYTCEHGITDNLELAWCDVDLWWRGDRIAPPLEPTIHKFGPIRGMCKLKTGDRIDQDASKKAMTDALTKGLSHLGFNADVFLGLFDDNKYVTERRQEENKEQRDMDWAKEVAEKLATSQTVNELQSRWEKLKPHLEGRSKTAVRIIEDAITLAKTALSNIQENK
jgi:hypothetical protein